MQLTNTVRGKVEQPAPIVVEELCDAQTDVLLKTTSNKTSRIAESAEKLPGRIGRIQYGSSITQVLLTIFPVLFIALASTAIHLDKKQTSRTGEQTQRAISLSPTVFPIVFAAITLESLIGSQTLFSAIEKQVVLRRQILVGGTIILLWALSPLGGQSALRLIQVIPHYISTNSTIRYLPIAASHNSLLKSYDLSLEFRPSYDPIFMACLITSHQYKSSQDLFGNVKVPSVDRLEGGLSMAPNEWMKLDHSQDIPYSSLLGIPVVGIPSSGNLSFDIVSRYMAIDCPTLEYVPNSFIYQENDTKEYTWDNGQSFIVQPGYEPEDEASHRFNIISANSWRFEDGISVVTCSMEPRDLQSTISCRDHTCQVTAVRKLTIDKSWVEDNLEALNHALDLLPRVAKATIINDTLLRSSLIERWLQNPDSSYYEHGQKGYVNLSAVPKSVLSKNVEVLINTYWQSSIGTQYLFGNLSTDMILYNNISDAEGSAPVIDFNTSQVTISAARGKQYTCNMTFAAMLIIISTILLLISATSLALAGWTLAPDFLGHVSSLTRDNPFIPCAEGSHLDGLERARALRSLEVTIGDVGSRSKDGYIAFTMTANARKLQRNRLYR
ncbi:hypothetical protein PFICI_00080 [Pestalotiopsis fici W106-1]|uniref:Uncharacterized protein n=1 Tax=Pestalotiopsis fici (strain W106-1 / CGMCC3.15140) TaxID=1229662 RepID=W3XLC4_PESFW|nr:uncharacterized protein PFICI_00080 [Pestalotiopsis fici W106-1]ETS86252.1 hypothetical protein PFICI_00080 [Pestalotiopsis fici W106-1]